MLTWHWFGSVACTSEQFQRKSSRIQSVTWIRKFWYYCHISQGPLNESFYVWYVNICDPELQLPLTPVQEGVSNICMDISIGWCKKDVTPLLMHWSYVFLALTHWYMHYPQSVLTVCPFSSQVSITFDPFSILPVPLPKKQRLLPIVFMAKEPHKKPVQVTFIDIALIQHCPIQSDTAYE